MRLSIDMTWPVRVTLVPRLTRKAAEALAQSCLSTAHARREPSRIQVFGMFGCANRVLDEPMFCIQNESRCIRAVRLDVVENPIVACGETPVLLIVVESPHKSEYGATVANPLGPARGTTGTNIEHELGTLLEVSRNVIGTVPTGTRVVVANPVQLQASLHAVHGGRLDDYGFARLRDAVWQSIWCLSEVRDDFECRVGRINPTWIVNACTGGSDGWGTLNGSVSEWLLNSRWTGPLFATTHPALWGRATPHLSRLSKVDLNHATTKDMKNVLLGVGNTLVRRIVACRPFDDLEAVRHVPGIGKEFFEKNSGRFSLA